MCRMMGAITTASLPVEEIESFGSYAVSEWSPDGRGHVDGWGIYFDDGERRGYAGRDANSAFGNMQFLASAQKARDRHGIAIVHVRNASRGSVRQENSHPFASDRFALAHNGTINFQKQEGADITDSEMLFRQIVDRTGALDFHDALVEGIRSARETGFTGLVLLATDGESLFGFRDYSELENYFTLSYCTINGGTMVSQIRSRGHDWISIDKGHMVTAKLDGSIRVEEVH